MQEDWWVRRVVLVVLAVVGIVTAVYAIGQVRSGEPVGDDDVAGEAVTDYAPPDPVDSEGPLRLGELLVAGRHGDPVALPEHTMESYDAAVEAGVSYLETQVVMTKDDELVVRADNELSDSTDVADRSEFADRETTKVVDGEEKTGWFTEDFTLEELESLKATEPEPDLRPDSAERDGDYSVIGFDALLERIVELSDETDREIGLLVEPVHASYFRGLGLPIERSIATSLRRERLTNDAERITVESDDLRVLQRLEDNIGDNLLTALIVRGDDADALESDALDELPDTIDAAVVHFDAFEGQDAYDLADRVHEAGLALVVFPISVENARLAPGFRYGDDPDALGNLKGQVAGLRAIGTDMILAEAPQQVLEALADAVSSESSKSSSPDGG